MKLKISNKEPVVPLYPEMYGFTTLLYQIVIVLLSIYDSGWTYPNIPSGSVELIDLQHFHLMCLLKITNIGNLLPSVATVTASVKRVNDDPPTMIETVFSLFGCTVRFGEKFRYAAVSSILRKYLGLPIKFQ